MRASLQATAVLVPGGGVSEPVRLSSKILSGSDPTGSREVVRTHRGIDGTPLGFDKS